MARLGAQELQSTKTKQHGEKQVSHPVCCRKAVTLKNMGTITLKPLLGVLVVKGNLNELMLRAVSLPFQARRGSGSTYSSITWHTELVSKAERSLHS